MRTIRRAEWFVTLALAMACIVGVLTVVRDEAAAGLIASHGGSAAAARDADLAKVREVLERKVVLQKLADYGVSPEEAMAKVRQMSDAEVHRLATLSERLAAGSDDALGFLIGVAILIILIIVILKLMNKEVIVR